MTQKKHDVRTVWFKQAAWLYTPISWQGWLITVAAVLFSLHIAVIIDATSHSVSDTLYGTFPFVVSTAAVWYWVALNTSKK